MDDFRIVHLDLKGAPPKYSYLEKLIPVLKRHGANGLLMEYEDAFPYWDELAVLQSPEAYSLDEIRDLIQLAKDNDMIVIPLVQTFGHFEFVLKHEKFRHLREVSNYPMALCPSLDESVRIVCLMIDQILQVHQDVNFLHIGADEVFHINLCKKCKSRALTNQRLFSDHLSKITRHVIDKYGGRVQTIFWDDMIRSWSLDEMKASGLGEILEPMVWYYGREYHLDKDLWSKYGEVFRAAWIGTAYKGATGASMFVTDISLHLDNHLMWLAVIGKEKAKLKTFRGFALTGWQRYDHYAVLCELLPVAVPCLCLALRTLLDGSFNSELHRVVSGDLGFAQLIPCNPFAGNQLMPQLCDFPGHEIYLGVNFLLRLNMDYERFLKDERLNGWMTPFHLKHKYTNPVHLEHILAVGTEVHQNMVLLQKRLRLALMEVYKEYTVEEWMELYINPKVNQLHKIMENAKTQIEFGARPRQYDTDISVDGRTTDENMSIP